MTAALSNKYKVGSTWTFVLTRTSADGTPIDISGLTVRSMFRESSVDGAVIATLAEGDGIVVDAVNGKATLTMSPERSAAFTPNRKIYFDVEMTSAGYEWQSETYTFRTEQQVTRDD